MACSRCGRELVPDSLICDACGAVVKSAEEGWMSGPGGEGAGGAHAPASPDYIVKPSRPAPAPKPGAGGRRVTFAVLGVAGVSLFVVLLLGFVAGPRWFTGGKKQSSGPEQVLNSFYQALMDGDAQALVSLLDPAGLQELKSTLSSSGYRNIEQYMQAFLKQINPRGDLLITGLTYRTDIEGDTATVYVTGGKATYTDAQGNPVTETVEGAGNASVLFGQVRFTLRSADGTWYIEPGM